MGSIFKKTWLRWLLVLPTAILVWGSVQLLIAFLITAPFYSTLVEAVYGPLVVLLKEYTFYAVAPYWAIIFGASVAPKHNFEVSLILAVLIAGAQITVAITILFIGANRPFWILIGTIVFIVAITMACNQVKKDFK